MNIRDIRQVFTSSESVTGEVTKFATVDMDGDGENEIVLWISTGSLDEGFEVLHYQDGEVYGYHFWYRALNCLQEDGTFEASGGASDTSIRRIRFLEKGYAIDTLEEFNEALSHQNEKASVRWNELTTENIEDI